MTDGHISVSAVIGARHNFDRNKTAHLSQASYRSSRRHDRASTVKDDPDLAFAGHNRRLTHKTKEPTALITHRQILLPKFLGRLLDIGNQVEIETAVCAQRDGNKIPDVI